MKNVIWNIYVYSSNSAHVSNLSYRRSDAAAYCTPQRASEHTKGSVRKTWNSVSLYETVNSFVGKLRNLVLYHPGAKYFVEKLQNFVLLDGTIEGSLQSIQNLFLVYQTIESSVREIRKFCFIQLSHRKVRVKSAKPFPIFWICKRFGTKSTKRFFFPEI